MENESIDQRRIRVKDSENNWYLFLAMVVLISIIKSFSNEVPIILYLAALASYGSFVHATRMSKKSNEELWEMWENRWAERKQVFQIREAVENFTGNLLPVFLVSGFTDIFPIILAMIALIAGYRRGKKKWEAKQYYWHEFKQHEETYSKAG
ncbi:hypothetical protein [Thalassobacillus pellis]|uniref:hypothetical protein n=1 Tax=Thalassobacillus pellis TaxID=748008 RepID=UPI00195F9096|nr:hypothetical protein [Thalassobacillus pellis]MBM7554074.1 hypothetical protein [Thalassobacillus pellis]